MIPRTLHKMDPFVCLSAMQKFVRRGMEREAMQMACELVHSSKALCSMAANRLALISHEDIESVDQPHIIPFVYACTQQAKEWWTADKPGKSRMALGNAIRMMCRAVKSREGDHFSGAIGLPSQMFGAVPEIPDYAYDHHTRVGLKKGRGINYFREESAKLIPPQGNKDPYEDEFYHWQNERFSQNGSITTEDDPQE
jgi:replication-associated recombination protein RarA